MGTGKQSLERFCPAFSVNQKKKLKTVGDFSKTTSDIRSNPSHVPLIRLYRKWK